MVNNLLNLTGSAPCKPMGFEMNQNRMCAPVWSYAMEILPPKRVIELGSYNGGFAIMLAFAGWSAGVRVHSFDRMVVPTVGWNELARYFGIRFYQGDIFSQEDLIGTLIGAPGRVFVLCDNGNKVREFNIFSKYLKEGDVIAAHDLQTPYWDKSEFTKEEVKESVAQYGLELWMEETFALAGWAAYLKGIQDNRPDLPAHIPRC